MNRASIFLLLCLFPFMGMAQVTTDSGLTRLAERARLFGERIPQEKVFVQMDNTCYFLGDTIWFSAFTRRTNNGRPSEISRVLYAELWNHDGFLVERKLVEMRDGRGSGFFALPDTLYSGYFELRAYTRWQLNWGEFNRLHSQHTKQWFYNEEMYRDFFRDYDKLYSRVFPVYDKPLKSGEYYRDMTLRPLRRYYTNSPDSLKLSLFPEGGNMVAGMPCRVAFEAALEDGEYCEGSLSLTLSQGEGTIVAQTENRGRGAFTFTPEEGKSYEAVFTSSDGKTAKQKIKDFEKEGVSLQVRQEGDQWVLDIHTNLDKPLGMTIMHEGVVQHYETLNNTNSHSLILSFSQSQLKEGINQVTIFDEVGRVWADRLFFVTKPELTKPTIAVTGLKEEYGPFEPVELDVKCHMSNGNAPFEGTGVSLAVRDAVRQDNTFDSGNIMTEMLLASEIKGFVPQPEWFFEKDDEEHRRALDLLMMTQGWRRFAWREMIKEEEWKPIHPAEQSQMVTGSVNKYYLNNYSLSKNRKTYQEGKMKREVVVLAKFTKTDDPTKTTGGKAVTEKGHFSIELPRFYGDCEFFVAASDSTKWKRIWSEFNERRAKSTKNKQQKAKRFADLAEYYVRLNFDFPRWVKPYDYYQTHLAPSNLQEMNDKYDDGNDQIMEQVTVRARTRGGRYLDLKKPAYVLDAYEAGNAAMDAGLVDHLYHTLPMSYGIAQNYIGDMGMDKWYTVTLYYDTIRAMRINYNILNDKKTKNILANEEHAIWQNEFIQPSIHARYQDLSFIDKVYLYTDFSPRQQNRVQYGSEDQPSVEISLHRYPNWEERITYRNRRYLLHGFAYQEDFYHPDYKRNPPKEGQKDHRRTLYWNPDLKLDENGEAHVTLFNNSRRTQIKVEANGMTSEGGFLFNK